MYSKQKNPKTVSLPPKHSVFPFVSFGRSLVQEMKFRREYESQMVPEWEEDYLDYKYLKSLLEEPTSITTKSLKRFKSSFCKRTSNDEAVREDQVIPVEKVKKPRESEGLFTTTFRKVEGGVWRNELLFFRKLDEELDKVNEFYRKMVEEVKKEAALLDKQMDALIAFRIEVQMKQHSSNINATDAAVSVPTHHHGVRASGKVHMDVPEEDEISTEKDYKDLEENIDILSGMKIKIRNNNPYSTVKCFPRIYTEAKLNTSKENLEIVECQLKRAYIDFYQKLIHLKDYSLLNRSATYKILEKYDNAKTGSRHTSHSYMDIVGDSCIGNSDEVLTLMERVEDTIIKYFSNSNRRRGMNILRVKARNERHGTTFSLGFFTGCTVALIVALIFIINLRRLIKKEGFDQYMNNMFPLYSLFGFLVLHMVMYAANIYFWKLYRVNYSYIFGFKRGTEIGHRDILFLSASLGTLALATVVANLDMEMDKKTKDYQTLTELLPLGLLTLIILVAFCPFNFLYRSTRFSLLYCVFRCVCAPLYKSSLLDWFFSDQLTSQIQALRSLEFYVCYYGWGNIKQRQNTCGSEGVFKSLYVIIALLPYLSRVLQCFRHSVLEGDSIQGFNGLKHFTTIVAVLTRTAYVQGGGRVWWILAMISSVMAAFYCIYWDLVVDWGLLKRNSKNRLLRDRLVLPRKGIYYGVMVLNILLRFAWLQTLLDLHVSFLHRETLTAIVASLEILRRGIWNFFRLENEHLNLVNAYGAYALVPLPFKYHENEE